MDYFISIGAINYFYFITCRSFFIKKSYLVRCRIILENKKIGKR